MPDSVFDPLTQHVDHLQDTLAAPSLLARGEKLYSPAAVAKACRVPGHRGAEHVNGSTIFRHIVKGVRAATGELIRLEAVRAGSRWLTSVEAVARFYDRLTAVELQAAEAGSETPVPARPRPRQQEAASRQLDAALAKKS